VVLDPRYTKTAGLADEWYQIRPGTDMAFFLALMHVIISEKLYDADYAAKKLFGLEQLAEHVKQYSPEWAEGECQIPAQDIRRIARELAAAAPTAIVYPGRRTSDYVNSTQIRRSMAILNALLGNWDRPGGLLAARQVGLSKPELPEAPWYEDNPEDRLDMGRAHMMFEEEGSFKHMRDAIIEAKPYPIKGWFVYKHNPCRIWSYLLPVIWKGKIRPVASRVHLPVLVLSPETPWYPPYSSPNQYSGFSKNSPTGWN
jgi:thiosulfate reductase/polysulfide reductase chain A